MELEKEQELKILFCTGFITEATINRYLFWVKYYSKIFFNYKLFIINDGIVQEKLKEDLYSINSNLKIFEFSDHLGRPSVCCHIGWWRSQYMMLNLFQNTPEISQILHIENDVLIISSRMEFFLKNSSHGWNSMWCPNHNFAEPAIQVMSRDCVDLISTLHEDIDKYSGVCAEYWLPFNVHKEYIGHRWESEPFLNYDEDFACQIFDHPDSKIDKFFK